MSMVQRLQELTEKKDTLLCIWLIDLTKVSDFVDRTTRGLPYLALTCHRESSPSPANSTMVYDHACDWATVSARKLFDVEQRLRCGVYPRHFLFGILLTAVLRVSENADIMDSMAQLLRKEKGRKKSGKALADKANGRGGARRPVGCGKCADDADVVSRSPGGFEIIMMTVIVTACTTFGLTVLEAKTVTMGLSTEYGGNVSLNIPAAVQVHKQMIDAVYLGRAMSANRDLKAEVAYRIHRAWLCFGRYNMEILTPRVCACA